MMKWIWSTAATAVFSLCGTLAHAQQVTPSDGIQLPDASIATVGDAQALEVNPAGLGFMNRPEFGYGFQLASEDLRGVADEAQSYFLGAGTGWFGAGIAAQWLQKPSLGGQLQSYRKFTLGLGGSAGVFGFGTGFNFFGSSSSERFDGLVGVDLGLQLRASEHFSFGVLLRDVNTPFLEEDDAVPARADGSVALRLFDGRVEIEQSAQTNLRDRYVRLVPRLSIEPIDGIRVFGRTEFALTRVGDTFGWDWEGLYAGIELSLGSIGAMYAATTRSLGTNENQQQFSGLTSYHWLSPGKHAPLIPATERWIFVDLDRAISEEPQGGFLRANSRSFLSVARELERIADAEDVSGVVIGIGGGLGFAQTWELRTLIQQINASGKSTIALLPDSSLGKYYLASAAGEVWYVPTDAFSPSGLRSRFLSVRGAMENLGVEAQFVRIGDYKSTPETLLYDGPTDANLEQRNRYLDAYWNEILADLGKARGVAPGEMEALLGKTHLPTDAMAAGLVDTLAYPDEVEKKIRETHGQVSFERGYPESRYEADSWKRGPQIAVVAIEGNIVQGTSGTPFLGGATAGAESLAKTFERLRNNPRVRAVVVRIDSPGGSAVASDLIYRSIRRVAAQKPVVASMGNIAASGGYYVAAGADEIFAAPTTTTGSIGIFAGKVNVARLADRVGVNTTKIERGSPISYANFYEPWSDEELAHLSTGLNYMYRLFLTQAAHTRPLDVEELDLVARGRIWAGRDARDKKLVDELGGLMAAIHRAEELANLRRGEAEYRQFEVGTQLGAGVNLAKAAAAVGLGPKSGATEMVKPNTMAGRFLSQLSQVVTIPLLYDSGEALMLPLEQPRFDD